jgi:hypothetical protein
VSDINLAVTVEIRGTVFITLLAVSHDANENPLIDNQNKFSGTD